MFVLWLEGNELDPERKRCSGVVSLVVVIVGMQCNAKERIEDRNLCYQVTVSVCCSLLCLPVHEHNYAQIHKLLFQISSTDNLL